MRKINAAGVLTAGILGLVLVAAGSAQATPFSLDTVSGSVMFSGVGVEGTVSGLTGSELAALNPDTNAVCGFGTCSLASQDYAVFRVTITMVDGSGLGIDQLRVSNLFQTAEGGGYIPDGGTVPGVSLESPPTALFTWADLTDLNSPSAVLFVSYNAGELPTANGINFNADPTSGAVGGIDNVVGTLVAIPEPATAALLGLGLLGLAAVRRSRR